MRIQGFYINLNRRTDRREQIEAECQKIGISIERFPAIEHWFGGFGCLQSHLAVLKLARERGYPAVTIFEDDFQFLVTKEEFEDVLSKVPDNFDVLMLSYNLFRGQAYNDTFGKVIEVQSASGYIVHSRFYDKLIANLQEAVQYFGRDLTPTGYGRYTNDQYWKRLQPDSNWLYSLKRIGLQRPSYSDLEKTHVNYGV
jgi:hypothetical protein